MTVPDVPPLFDVGFWWHPHAARRTRNCGATAEGSRGSPEGDILTWMVGVQSV